MNWRVILSLRLNELLFSGYIKENSTDEPVCNEPALVIAFKVVSMKNNTKFPQECIDSIVQCIGDCWPPNTML